MKVEDPKVKEAIVKAVGGIKEIEKAIEGLDVNSVDEAKVKIIDALEDVKVSLKFVGEFVGADLTEVVMAADSDPIEELGKAYDDLDAFMKKNK